MGKTEPECFGIIGSSRSRRFCLQQGCDVKHRGGTFAVPENHLFVKAGPSEAYCFPSVNADRVATGALAELLASSKPLAEWVDIFAVLEAAEEPMSVQGLNQRMAFLAEAKVHRTPKKAAPRSPSPFEGDWESMVEHVPEEVLKASTFSWSSDLPNDLVVGLESLGRSVSGVLSAVPTAFSDTALRVGDLKGQLEGQYDLLAARVLALEGTMGERPVFEGEDSPTTIWQGLASLWGSLEGLPDGEEAKEFVRAADKLSQFLADRESATERALQDHVKKATGLFVTLSDKIKEVVAVQNSLSASGSVAAMPAPAPPPSGIDLVLKGLGGPGGAPTAELAAIRNELAQLKKEIATVHRGDRKEGISFEGLTFGSRGDLRAWIVTNLPDLPFGAFVDFFSLLQQVDFDRNSGEDTAETMLKGLKLRKDLSLSTNGDILALVSLRNSVPTLFSRGSASTGKDKSRFNAFPSFSSWKSLDYLDSFTDQVQSNLEDAASAIKTDIEFRLPPGSVASLLASTCLSKSREFTEGFVRFITTTYEQLTFAKFTKNKAWALTTALGERVCHEVHKERGMLLRSLKMDEANREELCLHVMWATLRAHQVMSEYLRLEFKDHPTIASEYVKFLATNSGFEIVASLEAKIEDLKKEVAANKKAAAAAQNAADKAGNKADEAKRSADKVAKKVPP
jgi:hypothetical protein